VVKDADQQVLSDWVYCFQILLGFQNMCCISFAPCDINMIKWDFFNSDLCSL